jgi:hypothetical protein
MYDRVVTINNTNWPAYRKPGATLVDLRMFDPDALIEAAAKSDPQGFLLFDDLPNQKEPATGLAKLTVKIRNLNPEVHDARGDATLRELEIDSVLRP